MCVSNKILLVEDDADEQLFFTMAIKEISSRLKCTVASNGVEAFQKLRNNDHLPDVIFLDLEMPMMDGYTFLKEIKKDIALRDIPVIILTTLHDQFVAERTRKLGAKAFITKPSSLSILQVKLHHLLNFDFSLDLKKAHQLFFTELTSGVE